ncbi:glutathione-dependent formaldehyde-activating enzyme [Apiospora kogelbergensis]|uniref:Glutathione-dependent formaldehyde-activating enzyme n=1 Tax=Apiospora kogelbergensis TaxID=1337665 RepID=A0AAW0QI32_9PEZI
MDQAVAKHYDGNCHCGCFRFKLSLPSDITTAIACTCGLCSKKAYLWLSPPEGSFVVTRDDGRLIEYDSGVAMDKFCGHCGTGVVGEHRSGPLKGALLVNVRAVQRLNPFGIESTVTVAHTEDRQHPDISTNTGPPNAFSCHCGNVTATLLVPLQEQEVKEDNCSKCARTGYIGVYPTKSEVDIPIRSWENTFAYGGKFGGGPHHCKTCGVFVFHEVAGPPISVFDDMAPERRKHMLGVYHRNMNLQPLNIRCLGGFDMKALDIQRSDEGTEGYRLDA